MNIEVLVTADVGIDRFEVPWRPGLTAEAILTELGIPLHADLAIGVYGRRIELSSMLEASDRLEVYRPLYLTPTERRKRQAEGKKLRRPVRSPRPKATD